MEAKRLAVAKIKATEAPFNFYERDKEEQMKKNNKLNYLHSLVNLHHLELEKFHIKFLFLYINKWLMKPFMKERNV